MHDLALANASKQLLHSQVIALVRAFFEPATHTVSYVVHDPKTRFAAVIDSVLDFDANAGRTSTGSAQQIVDYVNAAGLKVEWLLETHVLADHLSAAPFLQRCLGGKIAIGAQITVVQKHFAALLGTEPAFTPDGSDFDYLFADGEQFQLGELPVSVLHVPGHTPACVAYVIGDAVFVGDTLFMPDYGSARADFPGGDAHTLFRSARRLLALPPQTRLFMCHDYLPEGRSEFAWESTVAAQRAANVHLRDGVSEADFAQLRQARDRSLPVPRLLLPSIQVNMRAGHLPPAEQNGQIYLKIPINAL